MCHQIIVNRAVALMDKVRLQNLRRNEMNIQSEIHWASRGVAVFSG
jgi:hypothetical protein